MRLLPHSLQGDGQSSLVLGTITCGLIFIANICYAVSGFGSAILFQLGWHVAELAAVQGAGGVKEGVAYLSLVSFTVATMQTVWLCKHINWPLTLIMSSSSLPGMFIGLHITTHTSGPWLKRTAGVSFFALAVYELCKGRCTKTTPTTPADDNDDNDEEDGGGEDHELTDLKTRTSSEDTLVATTTMSSSTPPFQLCTAGPDRTTRIGSLLLTSIFSGLLTGLFGTGGPPFMLWINNQLARNAITVDEWRASRASASMLTAPIRFAYLLTHGAGGALVTHYARGEVSVELSGVILALAMGCSGLCAVVVGNVCVSRFFDRAAMRRLIMYLLLLGSVLLVTAQK